eukprot:gnl/TRDRNA2_/TRDRNA2_174231_c0_seq3.p1 gnl/TRDRNA2_/TRDRNA2_174231_c0~~gnl/TRDRNA2_/TRDRNA2_174231_c0_seq3.p1  ORF type:complete len:468 (+),score=97.32 gnl/TRDRNA2_/TRDRNA2_174231_c0_seq3:76-1479(+)
MGAQSTRDACCTHVCVAATSGMPSELPALVSLSRISSASPSKDGGTARRNSTARRSSHFGTDSKNATGITPSSARNSKLIIKADQDEMHCLVLGYKVVFDEEKQHARPAFFALLGEFSDKESRYKYLVQTKAPVANELHDHLNHAGVRTRRGREEVLEVANDAVLSELELLESDTADGHCVLGVRSQYVWCASRSHVGVCMIARQLACFVDDGPVPRIRPPKRICVVQGQRGDVFHALDPKHERGKVTVEQIEHSLGDLGIEDGQEYVLELLKTYCEEEVHTEEFRVTLQKQREAEARKREEALQEKKKRIDCLIAKFKEHAWKVIDEHRQRRLDERKAAQAAKRKEGGRKHSKKGVVEPVDEKQAEKKEEEYHDLVDKIKKSLMQDTVTLKLIGTPSKLATIVGQAYVHMKAEDEKNETAMKNTEKDSKYQQRSKPATTEVRQADGNNRASAKGAGKGRLVGQQLL